MKSVVVSLHKVHVLIHVCSLFIKMKLSRWLNWVIPTFKVNDRPLKVPFCFSDRTPNNVSLLHQKNIQQQTENRKTDQHGYIIWCCICRICRRDYTHVVNLFPNIDKNTFLMMFNFLNLELFVKKFFLISQISSSALVIPSLHVLRFPQSLWNHLLNGHFQLMHVGSSGGRSIHIFVFNQRQTPECVNSSLQVKVLHWRLYTQCGQQNILKLPTMQRNGCMLWSILQRLLIRVMTEYISSIFLLQLVGVELILLTMSFIYCW